MTGSITVSSQGAMGDIKVYVELAHGSLQPC